jgi:protoheme IX farnesyltransferase
MKLVVFTGLVGLLVAPGEIHPFIGFVAILCLALGAGASGALNMWYDADIDAIMTRTKNRPIPSGKVKKGEALGFGITLSVISVTVMALGVNWLAAALLGVTILYYALFYTMWLKRKTVQNIVIGGAAGAFPPLIGWVSVTGTIGIEPLILFAIIFMWTPPHFWALSLFCKDDYEAAKIPMLPVIFGEAETRKYILAYSIILVPVGVLPYVLGSAGLGYLATSILFGAYFLKLSFKLFRSHNHDDARKLFTFSILYLFSLFVVLAIEALYSKVIL